MTLLAAALPLLVILIASAALIVPFVMIAKDQIDTNHRSNAP